MKKIFLVLAAFISGSVAYGQAESVVGAKYRAGVSKDGRVLDTKIDMDLSHLDLKRREMVVVTPQIKSTDKGEMAELTPVIVAGNKKYKELKRSRHFGETKLNPEPETVIRYKKKKVKDYTYRPSTQYEPWMREASMNINERVCACPKHKERVNEVPVSSRMLPPAFVPQYKVAYVTPPAEAVKQRSDDFTARVNYQVGKSAVVPSYGGNAEVLGGVNKFMNDLRADSDLTITQFVVTGYASPDGNFNSNMNLSRKRAESFMEYLKDHFGAEAPEGVAEGQGEDWNGLYAAVANSDLADKDQVLAVIDNNADINKRKQALRNLSGGRTYRTLLNDFFPELRRNEIEVQYVARAFDINEAREIIHTKPQLLSLNEMFLVANSYPQDSQEFKEVFDIAARVYPESWYANANNAALEIESGAYDKALRHMEGDGNPNVLNNMGVAYARKGDLDKAEKYFKLAAESGSKDGEYNLDQLDQYRNDR